LATVGHGGLVLLEGYDRHPSLQFDDVWHSPDKAPGWCAVKPLPAMNLANIAAAISK
jgi:hypothetical protein